MRKALPLTFSLLALVAGCRCSQGPAVLGDAGPDAAPTDVSQAPPLDTAPLPAPPPPGSAAPSLSEEPPIVVPPAARRLACPPGMMAVAGSFCIDKWEASLVDKVTGLALSPHYPPDRKLALRVAETWEKERLEMGSDAARQIPLPPLPAFQRTHDVDPVAVSRPDVIPNGYLSGLVADRACKNASKRLCTHEEWTTACEGESKRRFPYGLEYKQGACNIFRALHPAKELHDDASIGHLDPRLGLVREPNGDPLLRPTGATPLCRSAWGSDAAWDMNGNLDEWVDDPKGMFVGGFFSRSKRDGCESTVTAHPPAYFDYSTGTRCCWSPADGERAPPP